MRHPLLTKILAPAMLLAVVLFAAPGCMNTASLTVLEPAHINISQDINRLVVANRYRPAKGGGNGFMNVLEGLFSGENIGQDRRGAETSLIGLQDALRESPRFQVIRSNQELFGSGRAQFPEPLTANVVRDLCQPLQGDALITIEAFDSDSRLDYDFSTTERKTKEGTKYIDTTWYANATVMVTVGWRMYDARTGGLLDEFRMYEEIGFQGEGRNQVQAKNNLPSKDYVTSDIGHVTGTKYSRRISPTWIRVSRSYYTKGSDKLKWGRDLARANDWKGAEEVWEREAKEGEKIKARKRAAYNMILAREIAGDLEGALEWSKKAMTMGLNKASSYRRIIARRQADQIRLEQQMNGR